MRLCSRPQGNQQEADDFSCGRHPKRGMLGPNE